MSGGYGVYGSGIDTDFTVTEQLLNQYTGGDPLTSSQSTGTPTTTWDDATNTATITLTRPITVSGNGYYDFADVLGPQCTGETMDFGAVIGHTNTYQYHAFSNGNQAYKSSCSCSTGELTTTTDYITTPSPTDYPTITQIKIDTTDNGISNTITTTPNNAVITTADNAITTTMDNNMTTTMDDGYELCATKEVLGIKLVITRNTEENMLQIWMSGPSTVWFGYGFGSSMMTGIGATPCVYIIV